MTELSLELRATGLYRDPSPHTDVPDGALREASDVVIRRAGTVEPRPGLEDLEVSGLSGYRIVGVYPYQGEHILAARTYSGSTAKLINSDGTEITVGGSSVSLSSSMRSAAAAGSHLYVPVSDGVVRIEDHDSTTAEYAGVDRARSGIGTLVDGDKDNDEWLIAASGSVAYRVLLASKDDDGTLRVGPPSGRFVVEADGSNDKAVQLTLPLLDTWAGLFLQVYRSETNGAGDPSDELAFCFEHEITATEAAAETVTLVDKIPEADRGAALYTNESQQGAQNEHQRPPIADCIESHNGMMFVGSTAGRSSLVMTFPVIPTSYFDNSGGTAAVDISSGSTATANNTWPDDHDYSGLYITEAGFAPDLADSYFDPNTRVDYDGADWTLSAAALGTDTGLSVALYEWMQIGAGSTTNIYFCPELEEDLAAGFVAGNDGNLGAALLSFDRVFGNLAYAINRADSSIVASHLGNGVLALEAVDVGDTISVTVPRRLGRLLLADFDTDTDPTGALNSETPGASNELRWSRLNIPEAFPPLNTVPVGSRELPILALASAGETLYVLKEEGVWRVDGRTPGGLSLSKVTEAGLLHPSAVTVHDRSVFAWLDRGLVQISAGGIAQNLTEGPIESDLRELQGALPVAPHGSGVFLTSLEREGWLLLGVPASASAATTEWVYCLDMKTGGLTRWTPMATAAAEVGGRLHLATYESGTGVLRRARLDSDDYPHHDDTASITLTSLSASGSTITLSGVVVTSGDDPTPGDWIVFRGEAPGGEGFPPTYAGPVTSYDSGTLTMLSSGGLLLAPGSELTGTVYQGPECVIEWVTRTGTGVPLQTKRWSTVSLSFEELDRFYSADWSFYSDHSETAAATTWSRTPELDRVRPEVWRGGYVPRGAAWASHLRARVAIHNPGAKWRLTSLALAYQPSGVRAGRRAP